MPFFCTCLKKEKGFSEQITEWIAYFTSCSFFLTPQSRWEKAIQWKGLKNLGDLISFVHPHQIFFPGVISEKSVWNLKLSTFVGHLHQFIYSPAFPRQIIQPKFSLINTLQLMAELDFFLQMLPDDADYRVGQTAG